MKARIAQWCMIMHRNVCWTNNELFVAWHTPRKGCLQMHPLSHTHTHRVVYHCDCDACLAVSANVFCWRGRVAQKSVYKWMNEALYRANKCWNKMTALWPNGWRRRTSIYAQNWSLSEECVFESRQGRIFFQFFLNNSCILIEFFFRQLFFHRIFFSPNNFP